MNPVDNLSLYEVDDEDVGYLSPEDIGLMRKMEPFEEEPSDY